MKVYQLMAALSYMPAGKDVVLHCYGEHCIADISVVDYDKEDNVAIAHDRYAFEQYDKKRYGEQAKSDGE